MTLSTSSAPVLPRRPTHETTSSIAIALPDEVIELILLKCDVKSVFRFKSVSKSWQSIISDPRFFKILESRLMSENHNKFFFWVEDQYGDEYEDEDDDNEDKDVGEYGDEDEDDKYGEEDEDEDEFVDENEDGNEDDEDHDYDNHDHDDDDEDEDDDDDDDDNDETNHGLLYLVSLEEDGQFRRKPVLGYPSSEMVPLSSCNGLILLGNVPTKYMLWNPLIKKHITIPTFNPRTHPRAFRNWPRISPKPQHHLFFYDSTAQDHKLAFVYEDCYTVYSCKNRSWAKVKVFPYPSDYERGVDACMDGCYYPLSYFEGEEEGEEITYFDARDEEFHNLELPSEVKTYDDGFELKVVSGRLCLYYFDRYEQRLKLWVLRGDDGSFRKKRWRKVMSMKKAKINVSYFAPVCLSDGDDVVLWGEIPFFGYDSDEGVEFQVNKDAKHFVYRRPGKCSFKKIDCHWEYSTKYLPYKENLYMPSSSRR